MAEQVLLPEHHGRPEQIVLGSGSKLIWPCIPSGIETECSWWVLAKRVEISIEPSAAFQPPKPALRNSI